MSHSADDLRDMFKSKSGGSQLEKGAVQALISEIFAGADAQPSADDVEAAYSWAVSSDEGMSASEWEWLVTVILDGKLVGLSTSGGGGSDDEGGEETGEMSALSSALASKLVAGGDEAATAEEAPPAPGSLEASVAKVWDF